MFLHYFFRNSWLCNVGSSGNFDTDNTSMRARERSPVPSYATALTSTAAGACGFGRHAVLVLYCSHMQVPAPSSKAVEVVPDVQLRDCPGSRLSRRTALSDWDCLQGRCSSSPMQAESLVLREQQPSLEMALSTQRMPCFSQKTRRFHFRCLDEWSGVQLMAEPCSQTLWVEDPG
jgi:hypothetical protein